jgi:TM2 domain-containing membrane protein YozV
MDEKQMAPIEKSSLGAAMLSIIPGVGFFYLGNMLKGIAYMLTFAGLIVLIVNSGDTEVIFFSLALAGFYIFQIFDAANEAQKNRYKETPPNSSIPETEEDVSLTSSIIVLIIGILFQLAQLDTISYLDITRLWPLFLIGLGIKMIYSYMKTNPKTHNEGVTPGETPDATTGAPQSETNENIGGNNE